MPNNIAVAGGTVLDNGTMAASVIFMQNAPVVLFDKDLNILDLFGKLVGQDEDNTDMRTYEGSVSSYGNRFVFGMKNLSYLACYEQTDTTAEKKWEIYLEKPVYRNDRLDWKKMKQGFVDVKMTKNYIFASYCGQVMTRENPGLVGHNLLVFDHKGKLVHNLKLDREIGYIAVSEDEKTVYAIAYEPDICIVRYSLTDV